jgi:hypothetical protein
VYLDINPSLAKNTYYQLMKTIAFHTLYPELNRDNFIFENSQSPIGDDLLKPFLKIKEYANQLGFNAALVNAVEEANIIAYVFIDMPDMGCEYFRSAIKSGKPIFLLALESKLIKPKSYVKENHKFFTNVFTWDDSLVENDKYIKINYSFDLPMNVEFVHAKEKLCTLIAGNKYSRHPAELYSKRVEVIKWFEKNHLSDFDLYGTDWDRNTFFGSRWLGLLNRLLMTRRIFAPKFPSYKGRVERKRPILEKYKFAICYENALDHSGYITEKVFDCFFAGCIPVYWGADNISNYIPQNSFINRRDFASYEELYTYISEMKDEEYEEYLANIKKFISGPDSFQFSNEHFAKTVIDRIVRDL